MLIYATANESSTDREPLYLFFYHLTHDWFVAADIPVHYADAIRYNIQRLPQGFFTAVNPSGALLNKSDFC
jgi:hypothetical protein